MDDYYQLVGLDRTASREEIDRRLRDELRRWQRRSASADLARRQEAERRVQQLSQARAILLDDRERGRYDRRSTGQESTDERAAARRRLRFGTLPQPVRPTDWVEETDTGARFEGPEPRLGPPYAG